MVNTHPRDLQSILPSTIETYNTWVSSHNTAHTVDNLAADNSTRLLWIGPKKAKNVVLFFHGGGYVMPLSKGHLDWMAHVRNEAINAGVELSVCILAYGRWLSADVLSKKVVHEWGLYLVENSPWKEEVSAGKGWGMALDVPESWWNNFEAVDHVLVTGGSEEVFSDHIQRLAQMLERKSIGDVTLFMGNEAHDGPLMDFSAGKLPSQTTKTITDFVISCLRE
ncbi:hypothetical protein N7462_008390 [Penicillium macrosclerotiorum]|uniref:uncharacterized protein n=1 Tax=Penicillium macrosclerotiorum TaxID=303699 RepID=UPI002548D1F2|nr:uncharacterized protein N7462_008390 [Penicillium macrosclerotiorum]KAJ5675493.1 hypothetical protein N7462_008390 [Penicillium macrosclerotiorum]